MILLIHPPVAKPCEPPAGIARLSGALARHGIQHRLLDANIEGLLYILGSPLPAGESPDTWTRRAFRNRERNLSSLREPGLYRSIDRYRKTVRDLSRLLSEVSPSGTTIGLANYGHETLSPLRSEDLLLSAERPELNPFYSFFKTRLEGLFREKEPAFIGISLNFLSQALCAFSLAGFIRREYPKAKIVLGGGLVTSWTSNPQWKNLFGGLVDYLIAGPGEQKLLRLIGLAENEESVPIPNYNTLPGDSYLAPGFVLPYSGSSGCFWNRCAFCPEKAEGNPYIPILPKQVVSDLKILRDKTAPALLHLLDNAISPALLDALAAENIDIPWYGFARIGSHLTNLDFCMELKRSGCVMLKLGIESGDQEVLDAMHKGISVEMTSTALKNLKKAGIATYVYLIFGTPDETETRARSTLEFTAKHSDCIDFLNLAIFNMPVADATTAGMSTRRFYEGDLSLYTDFDHPKGWHRKRVRLFLENDFRKHPAVSRILKEEPLVFTSNHAPFFVQGKAT